MSAFVWTTDLELLLGELSTIAIAAGELLVEQHAANIGTDDRVDELRFAIERVRLLTTKIERAKDEGQRSKTN